MSSTRSEHVNSLLYNCLLYNCLLHKSVKRISKPDRSESCDGADIRCLQAVQRVHQPLLREINTDQNKQILYDILTNRFDPPQNILVFDCLSVFFFFNNTF